MPLTVPDLDSLPEGAYQAEWARRLSCNVSTLQRARLNGDLSATKRSGRRGHPFYTKRAVLKWLGMDDEIVVESPTLRALRKARKAYAAR